MYLSRYGLNLESRAKEAEFARELHRSRSYDPKLVELLAALMKKTWHFVVQSVGSMRSVLRDKKALVTTYRFTKNGSSRIREQVSRPSAMR